MSTHTAWAYTWDVLEGDAIAEAAAVGLDALVVAASYHSVRAHAPRLRTGRIVTADAGVYFTPDRRLYGEIEPVIADGSAFDRCVELGMQRDVEVHAWVVLTHSTPLGLRHPEHVVANAFGDLYTYALCASSAAVREYAAALVADVAQRGVRSIDLEAAASYGYVHGSHHDKARADLSAAGAALLSLCFCSACISRYGAEGVDAERLRVETRRAIDAEVERPTPRSAEEAVSALPGGAEAARARDASARELLAEVRARTHVELHAIGGPEAHVDGLVVPVYGLDAEGAVRALQGADVPVTAGIRCVAPDASRVRDLVAAAESAGISSFRYYHFGLATRSEIAELTTVVRPR